MDPNKTCNLDPGDPSDLELGTNMTTRAERKSKGVYGKRLKNINKIALGSRKMLGKSTDLPEEIENQLAKHIEDMEARFYVLTLMDLQKLAFQIAEANNISPRFNEENCWL
ncbi:unnamed protein product [Clavelina lepadiformis]|uniref:Uncharacterized protein n=1 Tax=Clavelina lepadiformis TaxID=159417 RepID=A0ABP0GDM1_CLALP